MRSAATVAVTRNMPWRFLVWLFLFAVWWKTKHPQYIHIYVHISSLHPGAQNDEQHPYHCHHHHHRHHAGRNDAEDDDDDRERWRWRWRQLAPADYQQTTQNQQNSFLRIYIKLITPHICGGDGSLMFRVASMPQSLHATLKRSHFQLQYIADAVTRFFLSFSLFSFRFYSFSFVLFYVRFFMLLLFVIPFQKRFSLFFLAHSCFSATLVSICVYRKQKTTKQTK